MKKLLASLSAMILCMAACTDPFGEGGKNAAAYVKEQLSSITEGAESVSPTSEQMLPIVDFKGRTQQLNDSLFFHNDVCDEDVVAFAETLSSEYYTAWDAWRGDTTAISRIKKYGTEIRKVYTITVTMPSKKKTDIRVIMESDGITPCMLESVYNEPGNEYKENIMQYQIVEVTEVFAE